MSLRDPEFHQSLEGFITTSTLYKEKMLSENKVTCTNILTPISY